MAIGGLTLATFALTAWIVPFGGGFRHAATRHLHEIYYDEGPVATIGVYEDALEDRYVHVDGHGVAGTSMAMQTDQKSLAHLPMMLVKRPTRALTVGFGSGGASYSFLLHPELKHVDAVEIAPEILGAADHLHRTNHNFLADKDPRYRLIAEDARAYLQYTSVKYDIIATDCTDLRYKLSANLYDREYFEVARHALSPNGVVVVWMPLGGLSDTLFRLTLRTFMRVFPDTAVFYMHNVATEYVLLVGWHDEMRIDYTVFQKRLRNPRVRADLAEIRLDNPLKLLATFVTAGGGLAQFVGQGQLNTQDRPILEFEAPRHGYNDDAILHNLGRLFAHRDSPLNWLVPGSMSPAEKQRFIVYQTATPVIVQGLIHERRGNYHDALRSFRRAQALTPEDRGLAELMSFPRLQRWAERGHVDSALTLASLMAEQGQFKNASDFLSRAAHAVKNIKGLPATHRQHLLGRIENARTGIEKTRDNGAKNALHPAIAHQSPL